jgi:glycosyltransferase involved in cell wall biosynthesis
VKFKIAGRDQYIPQYKSLCKDLGVADNFTFLGWVSQDQLLQLYKSSAIFILPSLTEALGVVFLEAMAAAVPVIGTNVGGIPEIIHHNKNGILVPVSNPNKIAMEVIRLFSDPVLSKNLAVDGMETVKEFSIKKMMACTNRVYSKFISTQIENEN